MTQMGNKKIAEIYKLLGPLNFNLNPEPEWPDFFDEADKVKERQKMQNARDM